VLGDVHATQLSVASTASCPALGEALCASSPAHAERRQHCLSRLASLSASLNDVDKGQVRKSDWWKCSSMILHSCAASLKWSRPCEVLLRL